MKREEILKEIRTKCEAEFAKLTDWHHDIEHVKFVVKNGRKISEMEELKSKDAFLVEIACWMHDLGRVDEAKGLVFEKSTHAERSYLRAKQMIKFYASKLGRESTYKVLQAVREHSMPILKHKDNLIARILQDADRGAGIRILGVYALMSNLDVVEFDRVKTKKEARKRIDELIDLISKRKKVKRAIDTLSIFVEWYYGTEKQILTGNKVDPLHTDSARKLYKKGLGEVEMVIEKLKRLK